jgi:hypothetical protein
LETNTSNEDHKEVNKLAEEGPNVASIGAGADKRATTTTNTAWPPGGAFATEKI